MALVEGPEGYYSYVPGSDGTPDTPGPDAICEWPFSSSCYQPPADADPILVETAMNLTVSVLRSLTLYRVGGCPIVVRPCLASCCLPPGGGTIFQPNLDVRGQWVNVCGCGPGRACNCRSRFSIALPPPVGRVIEVTIDGQVLDSAHYVVEDYRYLVRRDGQAWPVTQDTEAAVGEVGTFTVEYLNAYQPDAGAAWAASLLLRELMKACSGDACTLSPRVTSVARRGISSEIREAVLQDGRTGLPVVDAWVQTWNPNRLATRPMVWTPEQPQVRRVTS